MTLERAAAELQGEAALLRNAAHREHEVVLAEMLQMLAYGCDARALALRGFLTERCETQEIDPSTAVLNIIA